MRNILLEYFEKELKGLEHENEIIKSYVLDIFASFKSSNNDLSDKSLTLIYSAAKTNQNFIKFQQLADWIFFCESLFPEQLNSASPEYYISLAQLSYYSCYRLTNRQWKVFEQLSDEFVPITTLTRRYLINR